jgi:hypothetical protein
MPGEFPYSLSRNLLDITAEDIEQFVAIRDLKQMSIFQKDRDVIESDNETLEDSDECLLFEDSDGLDSDDLETSA